MLKSSGELNSSLKKPSPGGTSSVKKKLTFNLVEQLSEDEENKFKQQKVASAATSTRNFKQPVKSVLKNSNSGTFDQKVNSMNERYSPMVEFNSGIYLDYYTCKEFNKKVFLEHFFPFLFFVL
jgi:hypothetical protein